MTPTFLIDGMLGSLNRWLRICGFDAKYIQNAPDEELLDMAKREGRALLTRDRLLYRKALRVRLGFRRQKSREMRVLNREAMTEVAAWMKANDIKKKQITKDMVEQELASNQSLRERYKDLLLKQEELREIRDNCKSLAEQWSDRKGLLQTQAGLLKQEREVVFGNRAEDGSVGYKTSS